MAKYQDKLLLVDGFAGPGRYAGGEDGSPLIMLRAFLEHAHRERIERTRLEYFFVERHDGRFTHLQNEIESLRPLPPNVSAVPVHGEYGAVMDGIIGDAANRVPTFAFIDPFGYAEAQLELTSRVLGFPRCEVLIFLPTPYLVRFVARDGQARSFDLLYGGRQWEQAIDLQGEQRARVLHDLFREALERDAAFVQSFEIVTDQGRGYHLFFATNNIRGLEKWKEAAWSVDPVDGEAYRERRPTVQTTLFDVVPGGGAPLHFEPNTAPLLRQLMDHFGDRRFTIEEAQDFTIRHTRFLSEGHLKNRTLLPAERNDLLVVVHRPSTRGFPAGTSMQFVRR